MARLFSSLFVAALALAPVAVTADITTGLVGYYSFDNGTALDNSGSGKSGSLVGGPAAVAGVKGTALGFDWGKYVALPDLEIEGTKPRTVMAWFKTNVSQADQHHWASLVSLGTDNSYGHSFLLMVNDVDGGPDTYWDWSNGGYLGMHYYQLNTTGINNGTGKKKITDLDTTKWHHLAVTFTSTQQIVYLDGEILASTNWTNLNTLPGPAYIGYRPLTGSCFKGAIDEVRCYNRVLSAAEVVEARDAALNVAPVANAGTDQSVNAANPTITLDGSQSYDSDGSIVSYAWSVVTKPAGSAITLSSPNGSTCSFTGDVRGTYVLQLTVTDDAGATATSQVTVSFVNLPPNASAGNDFAAGRIGETVILNGTGSWDPDNDAITYLWTLSRPQGSIATLINPLTAMPSFNVDVDGDYIAVIKVTDPSGAFATDTVKVSFDNLAPVANAGNNLSVREYQSVTLNGSLSNDPNNDQITYSWAVVNEPAGSNVVLSNATSAFATFVPVVAGLYVVELTVSDGLVSATSSVSVTVTSIEDAVSSELGQAIKVINALSASDFKNKNMRNVLTEKINGIILKIGRNELAGAHDQLLNDVKGKVDGCASRNAPDSSDWIVTCNAQALVYPLIADAIEVLALGL